MLFPKAAARDTRDDLSSKCKMASHSLGGMFEVAVPIMGF